MSAPFVFVTGNAAKAQQLGWHLNIPVSHQSIDLPEYQSLDLDEIVTHKTQAAYDILGQPVLVEDTSLQFLALGRLPGPLIKWFLQELDNDGLCRLLDGYDDRRALASVQFGLYDGVQLQRFVGQVSGTIAAAPRGQQGFGWDPIFIPDGYQKTWAEMSKAAQQQTSMRRPALQQLQQSLQQ